MSVNLNGLLAKINEVKASKKEKVCITVTKEYKEKYQNKIGTRDRFEELVDKLYNQVLYK